jgi:hypothetical protein
MQEASCPTCGTEVRDQPMLAEMHLELLKSRRGRSTVAIDESSSTDSTPPVPKKRKGRRDPLDYEAALAAVRAKNDGVPKRRKTSTEVRATSVFGLENAKPTAAVYPLQDLTNPKESIHTRGCYSSCEIGCQTSQCDECSVEH